MATVGCGCKICKAGLGERVNRSILEGVSPKKVLEELKTSGVVATKALLKKHLAAFQIPYPAEESEVNRQEPIKVNLNEIDFSEYNFNPNDIESIIGYLQKVNLKIYLNQSKITLQAQQDVIDGISPDIPKEILQNLAIAFQIMDKSLGMSIHVNQQEAIKVVEAMGLLLQKPTLLLNAENQTKPETN